MDPKWIRSEQLCSEQGALPKWAGNDSEEKTVSPFLKLNIFVSRSYPEDAKIFEFSGLN